MDVSTQNSSDLRVGNLHRKHWSVMVVHSNQNQQYSAWKPDDYQIVVRGLVAQPSARRYRLMEHLELYSAIVYHIRLVELGKELVAPNSVDSRSVRMRMDGLWCTVGHYPSVVAILLAVPIYYSNLEGWVPKSWM
jgi:hypothetical protein